jgi:cytosine/adenosine deaminase-related metal-dependent hydrolase
MSPRQADPDWYLSHRGCRPLEHLAKIGVLGRHVALTHAVYIDAREQAILAETGTHITLCPLANMKGAAGLSAVGRFPDMLADGINVILGTDGYSCDILRIAQLASALFKDLTEDVTRFSAYDALSMITLKAAAALQVSDEIGSLEVGKKADFVCHDTERPEWRPVLNPVSQLIWSAFIASGSTASGSWRITARRGSTKRRSTPRRRSPARRS